MSNDFNEKRKVLIITDDTETAATLCGVFARSRFHIETCARLAEATNRALVETFSYVALDLDSQNIAPGELVAILRQLVGETPIICFSSDVSLGNERTVRSEGATMLIEKPVDPDEVMTQITAMNGRVT